MKLELTNHKILKESFESISNIVDEITLTADTEALHLKCLSRDHITFIIMDLEKTVFDTYQCETPEKISIDCSEFMKILKKCKPQDTLEIQTDEHNLTLIFKGDATKTFKIRLIDLEYDNPTPPQLNLPCNINIPSKLIKDYVDDMAVFSDKLNFEIDENYFIITIIN